MKKDIIFISLSRGFSAAAFSISIPFLNIYLYNVRGIPMKIVGLLVGTASLIGALSRIPAGYIGDRIGCKNLMSLALLSRFFAFSFFTIFIIFKAHPFLFLTGFILNSLGFSFFAIGSDSYIGIAIPEKERPYAYSIVRIGTNLGFALGPAIGGFLASFSYLLLFSISAIFSLLVLPLIQFGISYSKIPLIENTSFLKEIKEVIRDKRYIFYVLGIYLLFSLIGQLISTLSVFAKEKGLSNTYIGYLFSINGFSVVFLQVIFTKFAERIGIKKGVLIGVILYVIGYFSFGFAKDFKTFALSVLIFTSGEMLTLPLITTITTIFAKPEKKSIYIGFQGFAEGLGWATGPLYGGTVLDLFISKPVVMWGVLVIPGIISLIIFLTILRD